MRGPSPSATLVDMSYEPGTYVKGDRTRRANNTKEAVQAVWEGFVLKPEAQAEAPTENASTAVPELPTEQLPATEPSDA